MNTGVVAALAPTPQAINTFCVQELGSYLFLTSCPGAAESEEENTYKALPVKLSLSLLSSAHGTFTWPQTLSYGLEPLGTHSPSFPGACTNRAHPGNVTHGGHSHTSGVFLSNPAPPGKCQIQVAS